jgi:hypothetical protein
MGFWEKCDRRCIWPQICCCVWTIATCVAVLAVLLVAFAIRFLPMVNSEDAALQRFDLMAGMPPANSTVSYNATVVLAFRNLNIYRGIRYGPFATSLFFNGSRFHESTVLEGGFYHKPRKMARFLVPVGGVDSPVRLDAAGVLEFEAENKTGSFGIELRLETVMHYKGLKRARWLVVICPLKLQLVRPGVAPASAPAAKNGTNCISGENGEHNFCPTRCHILKQDA